eukprot:TRINITY_DN107_c1_g1_i1.p1 TRINITY_DN107_c1_g1~~TRINITY_DN107_c1_g1_i1.p1  ORF type:complete len:262 (+),score=26.55 TRINITY_DN107_c1_g1_i1:222-1007(+)
MIFDSRLIGYGQGEQARPGVGFGDENFKLDQFYISQVNLRQLQQSDEQDQGQGAITSASIPYLLGVIVLIAICYICYINARRNSENEGPDVENQNQNPNQTQNQSLQNEYQVESFRLPSSNKIFVLPDNGIVYATRDEEGSLRNSQIFQDSKDKNNESSKIVPLYHAQSLELNQIQNESSRSSNFERAKWSGLLPPARSFRDLTIDGFQMITRSKKVQSPSPENGEQQRYEDEQLMTNSARSCQDSPQQLQQRPRNKSAQL